MVRVLAYVVFTSPLHLEILLITICTGGLALFWTFRFSLRCQSGDAIQSSLSWADRGYPDFHLKQEALTMSLSVVLTSTLKASERDKEDARK